MYVLISGVVQPVLFVLLVQLLYAITAEQLIIVMVNAIHVHVLPLGVDQLVKRAISNALMEELQTQIAINA